MKTVFQIIDISTPEWKVVVVRSSRASACRWIERQPEQYNRYMIRETRYSA